MSNRFSKEQVDRCIRERRFSELFVGHGWDKENLPPVPLVLDLRDGKKFSVDRVVEKRGFAVCVCDAGKHYPATRAERKRLVTQLARYHYEHLLIICGEDRQCWTVAIRPQNRPLRTLEVEWHEAQDIQPLMGKLNGMIFDISEEEGIAITDVVDRVRTAFMENTEKITKKFYGEFRKELSAFSEFIEGIQDRVPRKWYAALMLNRLMFIYFIQKKHFLDGDSNYLESRLRKTQEKYGGDTFHNRFYRHFLRRLFSEGLGTPASRRDAELKKMLGKVPYLNGGLFDLHQIEQDNKNIEIPDEAFEKLFAFFGKYNWHLDTRDTASGKDINPDVIGYIFEKYINDRAKMGAYYTQEDITGYITRNTVIPFLLNRAKEKCKNAFDAENGIWRFLRETPDNYIYDAVKKGCDLPDKEIPENIRRGMDAKAPDLIQRRKDWNTKTPEHFALPTEIWRETIARRRRYVELKTKITNGEIHEIDDLITYNLDIERFASDVLRYYEGSDFIAPFYEAIAGRKALKANQRDTRGITVLDPACGSGAFLFAALNILEPLYEICIERMREFVEEDNEARAQGKRKGTKKHPQFRAVLEEIKSHPNEKYWIYKHIILNNLYGVDLMREAAEIAKLRLFLKLAATAEYDKNKDNLGLEPLPDIDFNIRAGNSLVGFVSMAQFEDAVSIDHQTGQRRIDCSDLTKHIREQAGEVQTANDAFRAAQDAGSEGYQEAKRELTQRLDALNDGMNHYLAEQYGQQGESDYRQWLQSHQPFHWVTEFYGIVEQDGGFDVVIGNPPYVKYSKVKKIYTVREYKTESCGDLYAMFIEKSKQILGVHGWLSMIVPLSFVSGKKMEIAQSILEKNRTVWLSNYAWRPNKIFDEANLALTIFTSMPSGNNLFSTSYQKWHASARHHLFGCIRYIHLNSKIPHRAPKLGDEIEKSLLKKMLSSNSTMEQFISRKGKQVFYKRTGGLYWKVFTNFMPDFTIGGEKGTSSTQETLGFSDPKYIYPAIGVLSSGLFWFWYSVISNMRDLHRSEISQFPLPSSVLMDNAMKQTGNYYINDLKANSLIKTRIHKKISTTTIQSFTIHKSKHIIDKLDTILSTHYGFTEEELDYIINYDIKYRMGLGK